MRGFLLPRWQSLNILLLLAGLCCAVQAQAQAAQCQLTIEHEWNSGFRARVDISNTSNQAINGWQVLMQFADATKITGVWHGRHQGNNPYIVDNEQYNATIGAGQTLNFGFNAEKAISDTTPTLPALGGLCSVDGTINHAPNAVATASITTGEAPLNIPFNGAQSSDIDGDVLTYLWDFGDGQSSTEAQPTHLYQQQGNYTVRLTVSDGTLTTTSPPLTITITEPQISQPYVLDNSQSSLYFVSTKKEHTIETHTFHTLSGDIAVSGETNLTIELASLDTGNDTRDERMLTHLFTIDSYQEAQISLALDYDLIKAIPTGSTQHLDIDAMLSLSGKTMQIQTQLQVSRLSSSRILLQNQQPILLDARDFDFEAGIETLKNLANLTSISYAVPVNFNLVFEAQAVSNQIDGSNLANNLTNKE